MSMGSGLITGSSIVGNTGSGLYVNGAAPLVAMVSNSTLAMNDKGIRTEGGAVVRMTHLDIFANTTWAWETGAGSTIETHVDNRIRGAGTGPLTPITFP